MEVIKKKRKSIVLKKDNDIYTLTKFGTVVKNGNLLNLVEKEEEEKVRKIAEKEGYWIDPKKREKQKTCVKKIY